MAEWNKTNLGLLLREFSLSSFISFSIFMEALWPASTKLKKKKEYEAKDCESCRTDPIKRMMNRKRPTSQREVEVEEWNSPAV